MNVNDIYERRGLKRQNDLNRKDTVRPVITRSRHLEANVDWTSLPVASRSMIDNVTGRFYFIVGVSTVGGGDIVRPNNGG